MQKRIYSDINGILFIDKEKNCTTFDIIRQLKKFIPKNVKAGHTGTLDPIATGLVIILLGKATRLSNLFHCFTKRYRALFQFGIKTNTDDIQGDEISRYKGCFSIDHSILSSLLERFHGIYETAPPAFSAKKIKGKPAYYYARKKIDIVLKRTTSHIYKTEILNIQGNCASICLEVSTGTYIRSIARDLGEITGYGCIIKDLRRLSIGRFSVDSALRQSEINERTIADGIKPINEVLYPFCTNIIDGNSAEFFSKRESSAGYLQLENDGLNTDHADKVNANVNKYFIIGNKKGEILIIAQRDDKGNIRSLYRKEDRPAV